MNNNSEMVSPIIENYSNIRFGLMIETWLDKAKKRGARIKLHFGSFLS